MKPCSAALTSYLASARTGTGVQPSLVDLYTFTLDGGLTYRWADSNARIILDPYVYDPGPILSRGTIRSAEGLEVAGVDLVLAGQYVWDNGQTMALRAANGIFDYARVKVEQLIMPSPGDVSLGTVYLFEGQVAEVEPTSSEVRLRLRSEMEALGSTLIPRRLFQPACPYGVYDAGCGLSEAAFKFTAIVQSSSTASVIRTNLTNASGYFDLGWIVFTTGTNAGLRRSVRTYNITNGAVTVAMPFPNTPSAGDYVTVTAGCDKTYSTCSSKFSNTGRFGGFPYVPTSDTVT